MNSGVTQATLSEAGNTPIEKHSFIKSLKIELKLVNPAFNIFIGNLSGPMALLSEKRENSVETSMWSVGKNTKEPSTLFPRKYSWLIFVAANLFARFGPTFTKYLLSSLAMAFGLYTISELLHLRLGIVI